MVEPTAHAAPELERVRRACAFIEANEHWDVDVTLQKLGDGSAVNTTVNLAVNVGSANTATITGNPQNMLIGSLSGIPYVEFLAHLGPVALAGLFLNWALLHRLYLHQP